ncbi:hypothetical protein, variant [Aphanomyces astaci]|uniref:Pyrroline-5-carboxylate reductase catalytic N-terminal domain-containing protein n=1 Tax=Aphanomyces astaci TaxID=112090 RepID=W4HD93_APHAT|nr:hypothetical protein, variant [Aphanomyces astaci]ETV89279.1 hypothetical protein, variant [Aphanomyces astaci]|eukprot:XP_009821679.1 hypothetical protein, variant [Aphanomyces astaci]
MDFNTSIDYANEITKLDPHLFSPRRLSSRIQPLYNGRTSVISHIANQCVYFSLVAHRLRLLASSTRVESSPTKVGIIGGGRVGVEIANTLLAANWPACDLAISSRQPHEPRWMSRVDSQVARYNDNAKLAEESDVVILAMPPSQLASVGIQIKHALNLGTKALVSILAGVGNERVSKVCGSPGTLLTRVSLPQAGSPADSNPSDAAAMQFACTPSVRWYFFGHDRRNRSGQFVGASWTMLGLGALCHAGWHTEGISKGSCRGHCVGPPRFRSATTRTFAALA